jgi:hypothetical protein
LAAVPSTTRVTDVTRPAVSYVSLTSLPRGSVTVFRRPSGKYAYVVVLAAVSTTDVSEPSTALL